MATGTKIYVIAALVWELGVALIYGLTIHYNTTAFTNMSAQTFQYPFADDNPTFKYYTANGTQIPFPFMVMILAFALIIVGTYGLIHRSRTGGRLCRKKLHDQHGSHPVVVCPDHPELFHL